MIDEAFIERFVKNLNQECPECGSKNIDVDWKENEDHVVIVENICEDCNHEWDKRYKLVSEYIRSGEEDESE